ncbi:MAG: hypothetical protein R2828_19885 [Saprospiraceae bacterium]
MKKEEMIISSLFEAARTEAPKVSFEEVSQKLQATIQAPPPETSTLTTIKQMLLKSINLNSLLIVTLSGLSVAAIIWLDKSPQAPNSIVEITEISKTGDESSTDQVSNHIQNKTNVPLLVTTHFPVQPEENKAQHAASTRPLIPLNKKGEITSAIHSVTKTNDKLVENFNLDSQTTLISTIGIDTLPPLLSLPSMKEKRLELITDMTVNTEKEDVVQREVVLVLHNTFDKLAKDKFFQSVVAYGGLSYKKIKSSTRNGRISYFSFHIVHDKGLNLKLRATNFEVFEVRLHMDHNDQLLGLTYYFNHDQVKKKMIRVDAKEKVNSSHRY